MLHEFLRLGLECLLLLNRYMSNCTYKFSIWVYYKRLVSLLPSYLRVYVLFFVFHLNNERDVMYYFIDEWHIFLMGLGKFFVFLVPLN